MGNLLSSFADINSAMETGTSLPVKIWMGWMSLIFLGSVFFLRRYWPARLVFLTMLLTVYGVLNIWSQTKNIHLFGVAHLLFWTPLAGYLWLQVLRRPHRDQFEHDQKFIIWVKLLICTIIISLIFDVRDIYLIINGVK